MQQNTYHKQTGKFIAVLAEALAGLPGPLMQKYIGNPCLTKKVLHEAFFPRAETWKTIKVGHFEGDDEALAKWLQQKSYLYQNAFGCGSFILNGMALTRYDAITELDLIKTTPHQIGFGSDEIIAVPVFYEAVQGMGLELCKGEVGLQLRDQYSDQPLGEVLHIGMQPARTRFDVGTIYRLRSYLRNSPDLSSQHELKLEECTMRNNTACGDSYIQPNSLWVFVRPRS